MKPTNPTDVEDLEFINKLKSFIFYVIDNNVVQYINSSELWFLHFVTKANNPTHGGIFRFYKSLKFSYVTILIKV